MSRAFALLQDGLAASGSVKALLPWLYGAGTILTLSNLPWLQGLLEVWVSDAEWRRTLSLVDLAFPGMMLLPAAAVFAGILRDHRKLPGRAYVLAALCLIAAWIGNTWFNLYRVHFAAETSAASFMAELLWPPAFLFAGAAGLILGSLPEELHRPSRSGSAMVLCYVLGAALAPLGLYAHINGHEPLGYLVLLGVMIGVFCPAALVTRRWITFKWRSMA